MWPETITGLVCIQLCKAVFDPRVAGALRPRFRHSTGLGSWRNFVLRL
jgi:hypothetical protein